MPLLNRSLRLEEAYFYTGETFSKYIENLLLARNIGESFSEDNIQNFYLMVIGREPSSKEFEALKKLHHKDQKEFYPLFLTALFSSNEARYY